MFCSGGSGDVFGGSVSFVLCYGDVCLSAGVECGYERATDRVAELRRRGNGERGVRTERVRLLDLDVACDGAMVGTAGKAE